MTLFLISIIILVRKGTYFLIHLRLDEGYFTNSFADNLNIFSLVSLIPLMISNHFSFPFFIMTKLELLLNKEKWQEFLNYKLNQSNLSKTEEKDLIDFIENERYLVIAKGILNNTYSFSIPTKKLVNKSGSTKKRVVYTFCYEENMILKFILFLMNTYDYIFPNNLFSFRKNLTVKNAFFSIINNNNIENMYAYKVDISNYFNSIDIDKLLKILENILNDDLELYLFLKNLLTTNKAIFKDEIIYENRGAMAGTSISTFFANIYLLELDKYFEKNNIIYARYSDDIIIFAQSLDRLNEYKAILKNFIKDRNLTINEEKECFFEPKKPWTFLGFEYNNGNIDISPITLTKIKAKIRRKARSIYRWKIKNNKTTNHAIKVMIRVFNNKFYREINTKNLTWCKWFFPIISSTSRLNEIDKYLVQYLRYLFTGNFSKKNYNITYQTLKDLGYRSLVNEYYKFKK